MTPTFGITRLAWTDYTYGSTFVYEQQSYMHSYVGTPSWRILYTACTIGLQFAVEFWTRFCCLGIIFNFDKKSFNLFPDFLSELFIRRASWYAFDGIFTLAFPSPYNRDSCFCFPPYPLLSLGNWLILIQWFTLINKEVKITNKESAIKNNINWSSGHCLFTHQCHVVTLHSSISLLQAMRSELRC